MPYKISYEKMHSRVIKVESILITQKKVESIWKKIHIILDFFKYYYFNLRCSKSNVFEIEDSGSILIPLCLLHIFSC